MGIALRVQQEEMVAAMKERRYVSPGMLSLLHATVLTDSQAHCCWNH
jgi:hypothetical protein